MLKNHIFHSSISAKLARGIFPLTSTIDAVLFIYITVCLWMTIYTLPFLGFSTLAKELTVAIRVMQSSSNE